DVSGWMRSIWALASAAAIAPMLSLARCIGCLHFQQIETHRAGFRAFGAQPMADGLSGVLRDELLQLGFGVFVLEEGWPGGAEGACNSAHALDALMSTMRKLEGEQRVAKACERHLILRTAWLYSPWGTNFLKTMLRVAATRPIISVVQDQLGSPTYVPDLASTIIALASRVVDEHGSLRWGTYH